jgi:4-hydroxyacetophenone monooxygenase
MAVKFEPEKTLDAERLRRALQAANIPTLLMSLFQLTGDEKWLQPPYRPTRTRGLSFHDSGGLPSAIQAEIKDAAVDAVLAAASGVPPAVPAPASGVLVEMMSACMGEDVPDEYAAMVAEEMGFVSEAAMRSVDTADPESHTFEVIVVGAGISGLLAAVKLREAGIKCTVLEKSVDVGGTWLHNQYPGSGVDTPSYLYSFSFFRRAWSTHFAKAPEVISYLESMVDAFGLRACIRLGHEVTAATYDEESRTWTVRVRRENGEELVLTANAVITALGQLNVPKIPDIDGMSSFDGDVFHSAQWPRDLDVTGKRVAVIGTGASAMQIVPAIAGQVSSLTIFQRSPQWVAPNSDYFKPVGDDVHWLMEHVPYYEHWYRFRLSWQFNDKVHAALQIDPEWSHPERSINAVNDGHREFFTKYLQKELEGRDDLIAKALPTYPPFGKRMLLDNGWFAALNRANVELVTDGVRSIVPGGVVDETGTMREVDVIVLATGFEARRMLHPIEIRGRGAQCLRDVWGEDDARAYLGITTPGYPNLFFMYGPNTNLGHGGSYIFIAECQIRYIVNMLRKMIAKQVAAVECRRDVFDDYNRRVDDAHSKMIWAHRGMDTWYRNAAGRIVTNAPWRVVDYWTMTHEADLGDFVAETTGAPSGPAAHV